MSEQFVYMKPVVGSDTPDWSNIKVLLNGKEIDGIKPTGYVPSVGQSPNGFYLEIEEYDFHHRILREGLGISTRDRHPIALEKLDTE